MIAMDDDLDGQMRWLEDCDGLTIAMARDGLTIAMDERDGSTIAIDDDIAMDDAIAMDECESLVAASSILLYTTFPVYLNSVCVNGMSTT